MRTVQGFDQVGDCFGFHATQPLFPREHHHVGSQRAFPQTTRFFKDDHLVQVAIAQHLFQLLVTFLPSLLLTARLIANFDRDRFAWADDL